MHHSTTSLDREALISFYTVPGLGRKSISKLLKNCQKQRLSVAAAWRLKHSHQRLGLTSKQATAVREWRASFNLQRFLTTLAEGDKIVTLFDAEYPSLLKQIPDKPVLFFARGNTQLLDHPLKIAIVGTRQMSAYGQVATDTIVADLVDTQACIVSGGMYGIDERSHRTCLTLQGRTIAVLGYGFDWIRESSQSQLLDFILEKDGLLISEYLPATTPRSGTFVQRNRVVAGLSQATIVVEAARRSGSLITAQMALDYDRAVGAVPGPITSRYSEGTFNLLREGAHPVASGIDIVSQLGSRDVHRKASQMSHEGVKSGTSLELVVQSLDAVERHIYAEILNMPQQYEQLFQSLEMPVSRLNAALSVLEMKGLIISSKGHWCTIPAGEMLP